MSNDPKVQPTEPDKFKLTHRPTLREMQAAGDREEDLRAFVESLKLPPSDYDHENGLEAYSATAARVFAVQAIEQWEAHLRSKG